METSEHAEVDSDLTEPLVPLGPQADLLPNSDSPHALDDDFADLSSDPEGAHHPTEEIYTFDGGPDQLGLNLFRLLYFLNGLSASTWGRFGVVYYNKIVHLSPLQIGFLQSVQPLLSLIFMPIWGYMADAIIHSRKQVYLFCKICGSAALVSLNFIPTSGGPPSKRTFCYVTLCICLMSIFRVSGVLDAHLMDYLEQRGQRGRYGTIRLWTAASWGIGAVLMGYITDSFGFHYNFGLYGFMMAVLCYVTALGLPARSPAEKLRYDSHRQTIVEGIGNDDSIVPELRSLWVALLHRQVLFWLVQVVTIGAGMAIVDSFLFVYLQNELGASTILCGLTVGVTVLFELPLFHYSEVLLATVGHDLLFLTAMVSYIIRAFGYTYLTPSTVQWVLLLEVLHGITFACTWIASIDFSARVSPPEWSTTFQSIMSSSFSCFGPVLGSMLGGWILERYHRAAIVFRGMAFILLIVVLLHLLIFFVFKRGHGVYLNEIEDQHSTSIDGADRDGESPTSTGRPEEPRDNSLDYED